jgi:DNA-binding transcriptional regulator GbsR (MarR family)
VTEITDTTGIESSASAAIPLAPAVQRFVLHWGNLGDRWGVSRSVSQIHALLYVADRPLTAEEIADTLGIARSNVSVSLRELMSWDIVRSVPVLRDRRTFYVAETDLWTLVARIAAGRKSRELDPAAEALRECLATAHGDPTVSPVAARRLAEMLDFVERTGRWYDQMIRLPRAQITALMKLGAGVVRLLDRSGSRRATEKAASR